MACLKKYAGWRVRKRADFERPQIRRHPLSVGVDLNGELKTVGIHHREAVRPEPARISGPVLSGQQKEATGRILDTDRDKFLRKTPSGAGARTCTWMTPSAPSQHDGAPPNVLGQANRRRWTAGSVSLAATSTSRESSGHWVPLRGAARCSRLRKTWPVRPRISPRAMCICASCEASSLRIAYAATTSQITILRYGTVGKLGYGEIPILNG